MNEQQRRKTFQRVKTLTNEQFWAWMNLVHNEAYHLGQKHVREAMECMLQISKPQIDAVMTKAEEIRETWDGMPTITVDETIAEYVGGGKNVERTTGN